MNVTHSYEKLFRSLRFGGVKKFVADQREEDLHLEFKTAATTLQSQSDKQNLAKALSGFANSGGGVIVWGVDARRNAHGIDAASALAPIARVRLFVSRLLELTADATDPPIEGVEHRSVAPRDTQNGVAFSLVPESVRGPHMAKLGLNHYYKRAGDSFYMMEHYDLADMFGKRPKPRLQLATRLLGGDKYSLVVGIENTGRGTARTPFVSLQISKEFCVSQFGLDGNGGHGLTFRPTAYDQRTRCFVGLGMVVFPDSALDVTVVRLRDNPREPTQDLVIDWEISAEDSPTEKGRITVDLQTLRSSRAQ